MNHAGPVAALTLHGGDGDQRGPSKVASTSYCSSKVYFGQTEELLSLLLSLSGHTTSSACMPRRSVWVILIWP